MVVGFGFGLWLRFWFVVVGFVVCFVVCAIGFGLWLLGLWFDLGFVL